MASCVTRAPNPRPRQSWHILRQQNTISLHRSTMETRKPPSWSRNPIDPSGLDRPPTISCYMHCMRPDAIWIFSSGTQRFPFSRIYTLVLRCLREGYCFYKTCFLFLSLPSWWASVDGCRYTSGAIMMMMSSETCAHAFGVFLLVDRDFRTAAQGVLLYNSPLLTAYTPFVSTEGLDIQQRPP